MNNPIPVRVRGWLYVAGPSRANLGNGDNDLTRPNPMHDPTA